jgi:anthranilate synthase/aminodeoxychorismate synthase-like glutamine amidotransferase
MILLIDNHDSFVHNLGRYFGLLGRERMVLRSDEMTLQDAESMNLEAIIISPGPCTPKESGISNDVIRMFGQTIPTLGVCLGHQCIGDMYGAQIKRTEPVHGRASKIFHDGSRLFHGIPNPFEAVRYHSLIVELQDNSPLRVLATLENQKTIMALSHALYPVYGVQFHPESCLTEHGIKILENFLNIADDWNKRKRNLA